MHGTVVFILTSSDFSALSKHHVPECIINLRYSEKERVMFTIKLQKLQNTHSFHYTPNLPISVTQRKKSLGNYFQAARIYNLH